MGKAYSWLATSLKLGGSQGGLLADSGWVRVFGSYFYRLQLRLRMMVEVDRRQQSSDGSVGGPAVDKLRIALCPPEFPPFQQAVNGKSKDATYLIQSYIAAHLQRLGHRLTFLAPQTLDEIVCTRDVQQPARAPQSWSGSGWFALARKTSWRIQRRLKVPYLNIFSNLQLLDVCLHCLPNHDVVYERNSLYRFGVAMACKRLRLPYVLYFEADDIQEHDVMGKPLAGWLRWQAKRAAQYNLQVADCVICVSEPLKTHLTTAWRVPAEKIVVFPNVADVERFRPDPAARAAVRVALGLQEEPLIIFVGNFYQWHDVETLLHAFAHLLTAHPTARLLLAGDGERRQAMMQLASTLGLDHAVQFTGFVAHAEVPRLLAAADIAVVPYPALEMDLWLSPLKLFESMAAGKAVVASAVGQLPQVIQDGQNGLLTPPGDVFALAAALQRLIDDPALRNRLGGQAREDTVRNHSWAHYVARLEQVCAALVAGQPVRPARLQERIQPCSQAW